MSQKAPILLIEPAVVVYHEAPESSLYPYSPFIYCLRFNTGACGGAVGWDIAVQTRKVAGSITNGVIFHLPNPSSRTMALESTQSLTEMNISWR
jgi:hypothetical protein